MGINPWLAIFLGIFSGSIAGFVNGIVITKIKINAFIATLGMLSIAQGVALLNIWWYASTSFRTFSVYWTRKSLERSSCSNHYVCLNDNGGFIH